MSKKEILKEVSLAMRKYEKENNHYFAYLILREIKKNWDNLMKEKKELYDEVVIALFKYKEKDYFEVPYVLGSIEINSDKIFI